MHAKESKLSHMISVCSGERPVAGVASRTTLKGVPLLRNLICHLGSKRFWRRQVSRWASPVPLCLPFNATARIVCCNRREKLASSEERRARAERAKGDVQRALAAAVDANR